MLYSTATTPSQAKQGIIIGKKTTILSYLSLTNRPKGCDTDMGHLVLFQSHFTYCLGIHVTCEQEDVFIVYV